MLLNLLSWPECCLSLLLNKSKKSLGICMRSLLYFKVCSLPLSLVLAWSLLYDPGEGTFP